MTLDFVSDIHVEAPIRQNSPCKRYVFPILVEWKNGVVIQIYRSYKNILDLQLKLLKSEEFLAYLNNEYAENRTGYLLTDKSLFGKLGVKTQKKILTKMREIDEFLKSVLHLPSHISQCDAVLDFFHPLPEDLMQQYNGNDDNEDILKAETKGPRKGYAVNISEPFLLEQYVATCDYKKTQKNGLNLKAGNIVEVIVMCEHGWWFVDLDGDLGWVPASLLTPRDGDDKDHEVLEVFAEGKEEICCAVGTYKPSSDDEVALEVGQILQVKQKNVDGWWLVSGEGSTGWAPCMHLHVLESSSGYTRKMERETVMTNMRSTNMFAITEQRKIWNPTRSIKSRRSTFKRRPHHDIKPGQNGEQPSYINMIYNKHIKEGNDSSDEESPSYINCDFKRSGKRRSENKNPSYMNMSYHNKNNNSQGRQRRHEDGHLVEMDFSKTSVDNSHGAKDDDKNDQVDFKLEKIDEESAVCDSSKAEDEVKDETVETQEYGLKTVDVNNNSEDQLHVQDNELMTQTIDSPLEEEEEFEVFLSIGDYSKESDEEVNLEEGKSIQVLEQTDGGWWLVRTQSLSIGWAPSNFLEKMSPEELKRCKAKGLEPPDRPPSIHPKSNIVHKKAFEICHERKFWSFVKKNGKDAKGSFVGGNLKRDHFDGASLKNTAKK